MDHDDFNFETGFQSFENLRIKNQSDRYQYVLPYYNFDKQITKNYFNGNISFNSNGNKYKGDVLDSKRHGVGTYTFNDGQNYHGEWNNDSREGMGKITWPNGATSYGPFKNDKRHGIGVFTHLQNFVYSGGWKNNKMHGQGIETIRGIKHKVNYNELTSSKYCICRR